MRIDELFVSNLTEMVVRYRTKDNYYPHVLAFKGNIWVVPSPQSNTGARSVIRDIKRNTGLRGNDLEELFDEAIERRPDILRGVLLHNMLHIESSFMKPYTSLLIRKVVQTLGLDGVVEQGYDREGDETETVVDKSQIHGEIPEIVFHGTNTKYIHSILKSGIKPTYNANWQHIGKFDNLIFLTASFNEAMYHANNQSQRLSANPIVIATRIPDRSKIGLDFDVTVAAYGVGEESTKLGYTNAIRSIGGGDGHDAQTKLIKKHSPRTDWTRETGVFSYKGRIPASFFTGIILAVEDEFMTTYNNITLTDKTEILNALNTIDQIGVYDPDYDPNEEDED